jgi:hypothetical protein
MEAAMTFGDRVIGALKLDENAFEDAERDPTSIGQAVGVIVLGAVSTGIGWIMYSGFSGIVSGAVSALIGVLISSLLIWLVGTKLMPGPNTQADFPQTFRTVGFASAPALFGFITIIPLLGWLLYFVIALWQIAATVVAVKAVLDYADIGKAIIVVVICWVIGMVVSLMLMSLVGLRMMMTS